MTCVESGATMCLNPVKTFQAEMSPNLKSNRSHHSSLASYCCPVAELWLSLSSLGLGTQFIHAFLFQHRLRICISCFQLLPTFSEEDTYPVWPEIWSLFVLLIWFAIDGWCADTPALNLSTSTPNIARYLLFLKTLSKINFSLNLLLCLNFLS